MRAALGAVLSMFGLIAGLAFAKLVAVMGLTQFFAESLKSPYDPEVMAKSSALVLLSLPAGMTLGCFIVTAGLFIYDERERGRYGFRDPEE